MHFFRVPHPIQAFLPGAMWQKKTDKIYLTFDDGPVPEVTGWVLEVLKQYDVKATFFCVGDNIRKHPQQFRQIISEGHRIGNHTYHHMNGARTHTPVYLEDIDKCQREIYKQHSETILFRPPYGRLKPGQFHQIKDQYQLVMWSLLTGDYNPALHSERILSTLFKLTKPGEIVVFHDQPKAWHHLRQILIPYIEFLLAKKFQFDTL